jgi:4'-phosphopantetheinyl transferase
LDISSLLLKKSEIHLWKICLSNSSAERLFSWLCSAEQEKAKGFKTDILSHRYIVAHAAMRNILSKYFGNSATSLDLIQALNQKPLIRQSQNYLDLHFSLSHSHEVAILAVSQACIIGVDIEHIRPISNVTQIAKRFFATSEYERLKQSSNAQQLILFFKIWTAKEAFLKAQGIGISNHLNQFSITLNHKQEPIGIEQQQKDTKEWRLYRLLTFPKYESTLALKNTSEHAIRYFNWTA